MFHFDQVWNLLNISEYDQAYAQAIEEATRGHAGAQHILGRLYIDSHKHKDSERATEWFRKSLLSALQMPDNPISQFVLGRCYFEGVGGVPRCYTTSVEWYAKSAEKGISPALCNLGFHYSLGEGVTKNLEKAFELFGKSNEKGNSSALYNLALCYAEGLGVEKNATKAFELYVKAATEGNLLASCYEFGTGVEKNLGTAMKWYQRSAQIGYDFAQYKLGTFYFFGTGISQDLEKHAIGYQKQQSREMRKQNK